MATTQQEYNSSLFSAEADYDNLPTGTIVTNGSQTLKLEQVYRDADTGFKGVVYKDLSTNEYIVSFTGTESNNTLGVPIVDQKDAQADIVMAKGNVPAQFDSAKEFMESLETDLGITTDQIQSITGHSLGGSLAQMIGALEDYKDINIDIFNAYGAEHLLDNLAANGENLSNNYSNINNYGDGEDAIYRSSDHIGNDYTINPNTSDFGVWDDIEKGDGFYNDHMFDNLENS